MAFRANASRGSGRDTKPWTMARVGCCLVYMYTYGLFDTTWCTVYRYRFRCRYRYR